MPHYYARHTGEVVSASINKYFYVLITEQPGSQVQIISSDLRAMQALENLRPEDVRGELQIPLAAIKYIGLDRGANLFLASEIPPGTGLGSSGAVSVCIVKALSAFQQRSLDRYAVAEIAYHINSTILGHPGGKQDEYGAAFGGLKHIEFRADGVTVRPLDLDPVLLRELDSNIMLFFTGRSRASATILSRQKEACREEKQDTLDALHDLKAMVRKGVAAFESGDLRRFAQLLHEAWKAKKRVTAGISNPYIDGLYEAARAHGALGGKITGAGGGGFMMLYCERDARPAVGRAMREAGAQEMFFNFDHEGVSIIYDEPSFSSSSSIEAQWNLVKFA